eukprot:GEMP01043000.1.p1 GENE.GEMP01043000.1~~GEMP01043000.1.p1  ORF type:complete len:437 (+),score=70.23 GEMP01043000.1:129-1439(+)
MTTVESCTEGYEALRERELTLAGGIVALCVTMIGTGIVALPYAFMLCGVSLGLITLLSVIFVAYLGFVAMFRVVKKERQCSYEALATRLPPVGQMMLKVILALTLVAAITCYIIIGSHIMKSVFIASGLENLVIDDRITFSCVILLMYPGSIMRSFESLNFLSSYCLIATIILVGIIIDRCVVAVPLKDMAPVSAQKKQHIRTSAVEVEVAEFAGFALSMPIVSAAMMAHVNVPLIYSELNDAGRSRVNLLCAAVCIVAVLVYGSIGLAGYARFGAHTSDDIVRDLFDFNLRTLDDYDPCITLAQAILGSVIILKTPLIMLPMRSITINLLGYGSLNPEVSAVAYLCDNHPWGNRLLSAALLFFCWSLAFTVPHLSTVLELVGAVLCTSLSYIIPGVFVLKSYPKSLQDSRMGWLLVVAGSSMCLISLYAMAFLHK